MIRFTKKKKSSKYLLANLPSAYDILKSNQVDSIFTKNDEENIRNDWKFVGSDLNWGIETMSKKVQKLK